MAWRLDGTYFESCSCDAVCPCPWSALTAKATLDRCRALLAYHVESGEIEGVDVSRLNFALFLDTPQVMSQGNWRVGVYLDDAASDSQAEQLGAVLSGQAGGAPPVLPPPIGGKVRGGKKRLTHNRKWRGHPLRSRGGLRVGGLELVAPGS